MIQKQEGKEREESRRTTLVVSKGHFISKRGRERNQERTVVPKEVVMLTRVLRAMTK